MTIAIDCPTVSRIASVTLSGACAGIPPECATSDCSFTDSILVRAKAEGTCVVDLVLQDGSPRRFEADFRRTEGCCAGLYTDADHALVHVTAPDCPACTSSGCYSTPLFSDCACRCGAGDLAVFPATQQAECSRACACGLGGADFAGPCTRDGDCALVPADCCGCSSGGVSTAVLASRAQDWKAELSSRCSPSCSTVSLCGDARAACSAGRCAVAAGGDAGI